MSAVPPPPSTPTDTAVRSPLTSKLEGFGTTIFGEMSAISRVVYALVGAAALVGVATLARLARSRD